MAYVLLAIGIALAYLDYQGLDHVQGAGTLLYQEVFGSNGNSGFYKFAGAMVILLAIGYIPDMEPIAMAAMVLVLVAMVLSHKSGFNSVLKGA